MLHDKLISFPVPVDELVERIFDMFFVEHKKPFTLIKSKNYPESIF
jgi:hypothetical protein